MPTPNISKALRERKSERLNVHQLRGYQRINEIIRLCDARFEAFGRRPTRTMLCAAWFLICDALYTRFDNNLDLDHVKDCVAPRVRTHVLLDWDVALDQLHRVCDIAGDKKGPWKMTTDIVAGRRMELESLEREAAKIRTMYAYDKSPREVKAEKRLDARYRMARKRLRDGATQRADSLTRTKPWEALGMSRAAWYRRGKPSPESTAKVIHLADRKR